MSRTSIVALVLFVAGLGYLLSLGCGWHPQAAVERLSIYRAIFEFGRRFAKANHFRAERLEIA